MRLISNRLVLAIDEPLFNYEFYLIASDEVNAFTIPGGRIFVFSGLLNEADNPEEVAAVLAHEIGHAIQFTRDEPVSRLRRKYMGRAVAIKKLGFTVLACAPVGAVVAKTPLVMGLFIGAAVATMLASALMYAAILPEEYDASFNKALPILEQGNYLHPNDLPAAREVLRAAALTYVSAALSSLLNLAQWIRILR